MWNKCIIETVGADLTIWMRERESVWERESCVCVCERERERERVCVCVCAWERDAERVQSRRSEEQYYEQLF